MLKKQPKIIILIKIMKNEFVPFWIPDEEVEPISFVALSDTYPNDKFEPWNKENWEEMIEKNSKKSVDSFKPVW